MGKWHDAWFFKQVQEKKQGRINGRTRKAQVQGPFGTAARHLIASMFKKGLGHGKDEWTESQACMLESLIWILLEQNHSRLVAVDQQAWLNQTGPSKLQLSSRCVLYTVGPGSRVDSTKVTRIPVQYCALNVCCAAFARVTVFKNLDNRANACSVFVLAGSKHIRWGTRRTLKHFLRLDGALHVGPRRRFARNMYYIIYRCECWGQLWCVGPGSPTACLGFKHVGCRV